MVLRVLALPLAALLVALPACGGDDPSPSADEQEQATYEQELRAIDDTLRRTAEEFPAATSPGALAEIASTSRDRLEEAAERLEAIEPPEDVADAHGRLADATSRAADEADALVAAAEGDGEIDTAAVQAMTEALAEAEDALGEIEAQGYEVRERP